MRSGISFAKKPGTNERGLTKICAFIGPRSSVVALFALLFAVILPEIARADYPNPDVVSANSVSGQFIVTSSTEFSPLAMLPEIATNQDIVRLEPALLAVSAERVKDSILQKLGTDPDVMFGGAIYLAMHPAQALDENITVYPSRFDGCWMYHVALPDVLPRERLARALTSVFLMDYANRQPGARLADIPSWLVEGFSQEVLAENMQDVILSAPDQTVNGMAIDRVSINEHSVDPLAGARDILRTYSILTFQQLCWPTDIQLSGEDGGVYRASAQLFVEELAGLPAGQAKLRAMLDVLPRYYNWQTAFFSAFHENFTSPLAVEKWWALQSVLFAAHSKGPQWTARDSRERLDEILSVAVDFRSTSNSLPTETEMSLQQVIQNFDSKLQTQILQSKLNDLEIAQFRLAPSLAVLAAEYRNALAGYLGESMLTRRAVISNKYTSRIVSAHDTLRILDALDARRRSIAMAYGRGLAD